MDFEKRFERELEEVPEKFFDRESFAPPAGDPDSEYVMVGEAPGSREVEEGRPFVGRAGDRLDEALEELGVERKDLYITNVVKVRPPDNRDPREDEIEAWRPVLDAEIREVDPSTIVTLGSFATGEILGEGPITRVRGEVHERNGRRVIPTFHPAATLYDREKFPLFLEDLETAFGRE